MSQLPPVPPAAAAAAAAPAAPAPRRRLSCRPPAVLLRHARLALCVFGLLALGLAYARPALAKPFAAIAAGLALFWVRWRFLRIEGVAGVPFSRASRSMLGPARPKVKAS